MIRFESSGSFKNTETFLNNMKNFNIGRVLNRYGQIGVSALAAATPIDSGEAANAWSYQVTTTSNSFTITWTNTDVENGFPVIIALQYGYGTGTGGYVQGRDFINPALRPIFEQIQADVWKEVTSL